MNYTIGTIIPAKEITKRFKDEDGEIFLEIRGMQDVLFRVTDGDRVYYKIEKEKLKGEELTLIVDYTLARPKPAIFRETPTKKTQPINDEKIDIIDVGTFWGTEPITKKIPIKPEEKKEFDEGELIPNYLKSQCKKNEYGGFSLRFNKFLYMLNDKYEIEIKSPDTDTRYILPIEEKRATNFESSWKSDSDEIFDLTSPIAESEPEIISEQKAEAITELQLGEILPSHLRVQCEAQLGYGYGSRITIGNHLYMLDPNFKVIQKMKISYLEDSEVESAQPTHISPQKTTIPNVENLNILTTERIVDNFVSEIKHALDIHQIQADYFKDTVLLPSNHDVLIQSYNGNLEQLNDDTQEAKSQGKNLILPEQERGFSLLKAALIHEFYIKSTLSGRGDKAKYFITHIAATTTNGAVKSLQDNLDIEEQKKVVDFFKARAMVYLDKAEIIQRVHIQIRNTIFDQYRELWLNKESIHFNALLISKLYENTTRLDRGDGITMMRLTRDIIDFQAL